MNPRLFVTGTGTNVGKTVVSTLLAYAISARYWKPVQSGPELDRDFVAKWLGSERTCANAYTLRAPLSPHESARLDGASITLEHLVRECPSGPLVIEGAGGVLVPLNSREFVIDAIAALGAKPVVVASSQLGTINHTLLTLEALRSRGLEPLGTILVGPENIGNRRAIETFGRTRVIATVPFTLDFSHAWFESNAEVFKNVLND